MKRRHFLLGTLGAGAAAAWLARPEALPGGGHSEYFQTLSRMLHREKLARPTMLVDLDRVDHNIAELKKHLGDKAYRIVAKSIPVPGLIDYVMQQSQSNRLMVFHQPFLNQIAADDPGAQLLLGKPMPVDAAARFYDRFQPGAFDPSRQLQWLVDTPQRLQQYAELAAGLGTGMRINIELDVGLHRGGLTDPADLVDMLRVIEADPRLQFSGMMGYDPHVAHAPPLLGLAEREFAKVQARYRAMLDALYATQPAARDADLVFNAAGSPTFRNWEKVSGIANEVAAGSALVKALDFDIPNLDTHQPALYFATPVLKKQSGVEMPIIPAIGQAQSLWDPNRAQSFFVYGGYWKARPVSPPGLLGNSVYGHSTNQEMLNGSAAVQLNVDDYVFYRPTQSEFVMLQFGDILAVRKGQIEAVWPVLPQAA